MILGRVFFVSSSFRWGLSWGSGFRSFLVGSLGFLLLISRLGVVCILSVDNRGGKRETSHRWSISHALSQNV
jgi:hypothetical protein